MIRQKRILTAAVMLMLVFCSRAFALEVPVPEGSSLIDTKDFAIADRQVSARLYTTSMAGSAVVSYYRIFFSQQGFQKIMDKTEGKKQLLRFKQGDSVVSISVSDKSTGTQIVIASYLQAANQLSPEEGGYFSFGELLAFMPTEDVEGKDLDFIPRPDNSIRAAYSEVNPRTMILYTTPLSVADAIAFYKEKMPAHGWELKKESSGIQGLEAYDTAKKDSSRTPPENPFFERDDYRQLLKGISILDFTADFGSAEITVMPNLNKDARGGSLVRINYNYRKA